MPKKIAIACQGGGSHAAFTAGVLDRLLEPDVFSRIELTALSGTSGGAIDCALVWSGLARGGAVEARRRLTAFWRDLEASDPIDGFFNAVGVLASRMPGLSDFTPQPFVSPAELALRRLIEVHVDLDGLTLAQRHAPAVPRLLVGATDVLRGERHVFKGDELDVDQLVASAAVPRLFRAIPIADSLYWDGLFACNPPIRELTDLTPLPEEIWVVRLNPKRRADAPVLLPDVIDRLNELSGNGALDQELSFIAKMNQLRVEAPELQSRYAHIEMREIELDVPDLDYASKFDRSPELVERLIARGRERALELLA